LGNVGISSINGETWTHCATCLLAAGSGASEIDASYVLSATGGETSFIVTMNTTIHGVSVCIYEAKSTVSALFDVANTSTITTSTPTTVADTLTGTNDFIVAGLTWSGNLTAVSASYANFIESNGNGTASNINTNSGSGAAFTPTTTGSGVSFTLAFQESGSAPIGVNFFPKTSLFKNTTVIN
jgi:hypothetical protein